MNTAPVTAPVISREIAPGVQVNSAMTGAQIFEAHLRANVQPHQNGQGHTDATVSKFAQEDGGTVSPGTIGGKAAPPTPKQLEAANKPQTPAEKIAAFDEEMRAAGKQTPQTPGTPAPGEIDQEGIELVTARYKILAKAAVGTPEAQERFKKAFEKDLADFYNGKQLTDAERAALRKTGNSNSHVPKVKETAPPPAKVTGWQSHIEDGEWVGLEHLTTADTSGYTIPQFVSNQRVNVAVLEQLKDAKAAGITQQQVNAVLGQHARRNGWTRA